MNLDVYSAQDIEMLDAFQSPVGGNFMDGIKPIHQHVDYHANPLNHQQAKQLYQSTLAHPVRMQGVGLHSGEMVEMVIEPAQPDHGIVFMVKGHRPVAPRYDLVSETRLCTGITLDDGTKIMTIEHLMAALTGLGIDNANIWLSDFEVPIMDGSAMPFVEAMIKAGMVTQKAKRPHAYFTDKVTFEDGVAKASYIPHAQNIADKTLTLALTIDFPAKIIGRQSMEVTLNMDGFIKDIAKARTFCNVKDVAMMQAMGKIKGGDLTNAIVVDDDKILNEQPLRYQDEFVRHKILDCIGDMALAGVPLIGRIEAECSGHGLHNQLLRKAFSKSKPCLA